VEAKEHDDQEKKSELSENSHNRQLQLFFSWQESWHEI
jgi:hypothetical protein